MGISRDERPQDDVCARAIRRSGLTVMSRSPRTARSPSPGVSIRFSSVSSGRLRTSTPAAPELRRPKITSLRPSPANCAVTLPGNELPTSNGPDPSRRHTRASVPQSASHSPSVLNERLEAPSVASLAPHERERPFPELAQREAPDLRSIGALQGGERVRERQCRVPIFLDLSQRKELLCLGAERLLHRPLLRRAAPDPELTHDREDDEERRKGGPDGHTRLASASAGLGFHRLAERLLERSQPTGIARSPDEIVCERRTRPQEIDRAPALVPEACRLPELITQRAPSQS